MAPLAALIPMFIAALPSAASIGTAATIGGTALAVTGTLAAADAQKNASITSENIANANAQTEATELRQRSASEMATSQLQAQQEKRKENALVSKQMAMYGASGGGGGGSASTVEANTEGQGDYNSELDLWQGQTRQADYSDKANQVLFGAQEGGMQMQEARDTSSALMPLQIGSQLISGASNYAKFSGPSSSSSTLIGSDYDADSGWYTNTYKNSPYRYG